MEIEDHDRPEATGTDSASWGRLHFSDPDETLDIGLSEYQLREEYDNEEIERFLSLFAANVTEVHIPPSRENWPSTPDVNSEMEWTSGSISEELAVRCLLPYLPPPPPHPPPFTLGRLRLATQRLYLSTIPVYIPFLSKLFKLAIWEEKHTSGFYCLIYWVLWYYDLLLPALILRILYHLVRRRIFPYPTATELRKRQIEIERAKELGDEVSARLASSSSFDIPEMWRIFRIITKSVKSDVRKHEKVKDKYKYKIGKEKGKGKETASSDRSDVDVDASTVLDSPMENQQERDLKRSILQCASTIADFHERIHNLFIWRRPKASFHYGVLMVMCFLLTLLLPTQYIAKLVYFVAGVLFWHVVPVLAAFPYEHRARLPPPLSDVPTDADYAMELISQRINAGLDVKPQRKGHKKESKVNDTKITSRPLSPGPIGASNADKNINWKKWGERAAMGKAWAVDNKLIGGNKEVHRRLGDNAPLVPPAATASPVESHAFPCQHSNGPGLITLSPAIFYFTPLMTPHPTVVFPLTYLTVVKKSGLLKGLTLRWTDTQDGKNEHEEIFIWVGGRDELFARLLGSDVGKWRRA